MAKVTHTAPATELFISIKYFIVIGAIAIISNMLTYSVARKTATYDKHAAISPNRLYLSEKASRYVPNIHAFENKVKAVGQQLNVPPEWLMAVMYSESQFNARVKNHRGSGATGLIQWMPATAKDMGISVQQIRNMSAVEQMDYVYLYLNRVRNKYKDYTTLTDLYLAILYPRALSGDYCYTLYATPSKAYKMNSGLDFDKDGRVTVKDIDERMKRKFSPAYYTALAMKE